MKIRIKLYDVFLILLLFQFLPLKSAEIVYINVQNEENIVESLIFSNSETIDFAAKDTIPQQSTGRSGVKNSSDSTSIKNDTIPRSTSRPGARSGVDTTATDTLVILNPVDFGYNVSGDSLRGEVVYNATDSIIYDIAGEKILLYGNADVTYNEINMKAAFIEFDWRNNLLTATGAEDSAGVKRGVPEFLEGDQTYRSQRIVYNFKSRKGKIYDLITQEGEGYIHGQEVKKDPDNNLYAYKAKYTTCNLDHPHFWIEANPLKIIPDQILVCGPTNLVIEGVRTPLVLPFAIFPIKKGQRSGILPPEFSDTRELGFGLLNGGYYFGLSDHYDLELRGDIYTSGSWRLKANTNFIKRYKYRGNLNVSYGNLRFGDELEGSLQSQRDFSISGSFNVDPKIWPNNVLTASVNVATRGYNRFNAVDFDSRFNNFYSSSINYTRIFPGKPYNFSMGLRHNQNTQSGLVTLSLPEATFGVSRINPFQSKVRVGAPRWYENIGVTYNAQAINRVQVIDSLLFRNDIFDKFETGINHTANVNTTIKIFKYLNLNPAFSYTERWYFRKLEYIYDPIETDSITTFVQIDTINRFNSVRFFNVSVPVRTSIYGRANFRSGKIKAIRHVLSPSVSFNYQPDFSSAGFGYYNLVRSNPEGDYLPYPVYPTELFGFVPTGKQAGIGFTLNNNLEMKVRSERDTVNQERKIKLLENFSLSSFYNFAVDSFNLSPVTMRGYTTLFERINFDFSAAFDPYTVNENGRRVNNYLISETGNPLRFVNAILNLSANFGSRSNSINQRDYISDFAYPNEPINYLDYNVPWSGNIGYAMTINKGYLNNPDTIILLHTMNLDLNINITPLWRLSFGASYNITENKFTYGDIQVYRDLHCWEMRFRYVPFGSLRQYSFGINVKSSILKDLKIEKKSNVYDNVQF